MSREHILRHKKWVKDIEERIIEVPEIQLRCCPHQQQHDGDEEPEPEPEDKDDE